MAKRSAVVVIGAGLGGLAAALALARRGLEVRILEARTDIGGLAGGVEHAGFCYDGGPYILLDQPGLECGFAALGLNLAEQVPLQRIDDVYAVSGPGGWTCRVYADLQRTAEGLERIWPGSGAGYARFIKSLEPAYRALHRFGWVERPTPSEVVRSGAWRYLPFLARSLGSLLDGSRLPRPVADTVGIWTHVAGQTLAQAPSPLAFLPLLIHTVGAFYPIGGVRAVPRALADAAVRAGVQIECGVRVRAIRSHNGRVRGVETSDGALQPADMVISNASGLSTYLELLDTTPPAVARRLRRIPLQSPGVAAYLAIRGRPHAPYLRYYLPGGSEQLRFLVTPGVLDPALEHDGWWPARLMAPMHYAAAEQLGPPGQRAFVEWLLQETWWQDGIEDVRVLDTRVPSDWGAEYHLYRDSMNPVMSRWYMGMGRLSHRSRYVQRLYLAGSSTFPGYSVSFCVISGLLAAQAALADLG